MKNSNFTAAWKENLELEKILCEIAVAHSQQVLESLQRIKPIIQKAEKEEQVEIMRLAYNAMFQGTLCPCFFAIEQTTQAKSANDIHQMRAKAGYQLVTQFLDALDSLIYKEEAEELARKETH